MTETHLSDTRQTVKLGLIKVIPELFTEETFKAVYSIADGVYCELAGSAISKREVALLSAKLQEWIEEDSQIKLLFKEDYYYYQVGDIVVKTIHLANCDTKMIPPYRLIHFSNGFIVDFDYSKEEGDKPYLLPQRLSEAYQLVQVWLEDLKLELVPDVNAYINSGRGIELLNISEAIQEKKISLIADQITTQRRAIRVVLISGPSSSGKTTFAQRLSTQLRVNGLKTVPLSLDDYFLNIKDRPCDAEGNCDFDSVYSLDLKLLHQQAKDLLEGNIVETPIFDFVSGKRSKKTRPMHLDPNEILIIEGIHALNPNLLAIDKRNILFKIYVSSLFLINIDLMNRVPTTDTRLIRRMVRGDLFRGVSPEQTFDMWANVRKGEQNNVFKFQEDADVMFNSSIIYELNALRPFAEAALQKMPEDSPHNATKERLLNLLSFFEPLEASKVPFNSILREFIGGSIYYPEKRIKIY